VAKPKINDVERNLIRHGPSPFPHTVAAEGGRQTARAGRYVAGIGEELQCQQGYDFEAWRMTTGRDERRQADPTHALLTEIREATFISNRAFVFLKKLEWQFRGQKSTHTIVGWKFTPQWENGGNTPTKYMTSRINYVAFPEALDPTFDCPDIGDLQVCHTMIGPHAIMHAAQIDIPVEVLDKIKDGELHAYLWGWAEYNDVFPGTPRHRSEFCFEIVVDGDVRTENCQFLFRRHGRHNGCDDECLFEPRRYVPEGDEQFYKFLDTTDIDKVLSNHTIKVSSFEYFRKLEATEWGDIADPLEGASELTVKGEFVLRENSPELEMANKANIGLGMFRQFARVESGGIVNMSNTRFVHAIPNLFMYCASVGKIDELTTAICENAEKPYDACLRIVNLAALQQRIFETGWVRDLNCKVSDLFHPGFIQAVKYQARSRDIREGEVIAPSPFTKAEKYKPQSEVRMLLVPKEGAEIGKDTLIIEIAEPKALFTEVFRNYRRKGTSGQ
jgi:hypothetical protein